MTRKILGASALAAAALLVGAAPVAKEHRPKEHRIVIDNMKFGVLPQDARVGDRILWINRDMFRHTATARDGSFNVDLPAGKTGTTILRQAGAVRFYCTFHPGMVGTLTVGR